MKKQKNLRGHPEQIDLWKREAIRLKLSGSSARAVSINLCVPLSTVYKWFRDYSVMGEETFAPHKRGRKIGTGRILNSSEMKELLSLIKNRLPADFNLNYSVWNRRAIAELVLAKFNKITAIRTIGDYLKRYNYSM
ncbi:MAG: hypothetical protein LBR11_12935 [Deltaproteobacteria bacterium]|jgi:transposase|nr:hypothetical protein [Deltaproteobacteria bacterium]